MRLTGDGLNAAVTSVWESVGAEDTIAIFTGAVLPRTAGIQKYTAAPVAAVMSRRPRCAAVTAGQSGSESCPSTAGADGAAGVALIGGPTIPRRPWIS